MGGDCTGGDQSSSVPEMQRCQARYLANKKKRGFTPRFFVCGIPYAIPPLSRIASEKLV